MQKPVSVNVGTDIPELIRVSRVIKQEPQMTWFVKKLLDLLPFNGDKTKLAVISTAYGILRDFYPDIPFPASADPMTWTLASVLAALVFAAHKVLKSKFPEVPWPKD